MSVEDAIIELVRAEVRKLLPELLADHVPEYDEFVDTVEAARVCGLSKQFFECGRSRGDRDLPQPHRLGRRVLYSRSELVEWMRSHREERSP